NRQRTRHGRLIKGLTRFATFAETRADEMGSPHLALCRVERHRPDDHASTAQFLQPHDASLRPPQNENTEISGSAVARLSPRGAGSNRTGSAFGSAPVTGARGAHQSRS